MEPRKEEIPQLVPISSDKPTIEVLSLLDALEKGVSAIFSRWTALNLAVVGGWGGRNSSAKAKDLMFDVLDLYEDLEPNQEVYQDDIQVLLEDSLEEQFRMILEDDSTKEIAWLVVKLWSELKKKDYTLFNKTILSPIPNGCEASIFQGPQNQNFNSDDEYYEDLEDEEDEQGEENDMQVDPNTPVLSKEDEEEGWELVPSKKKNNKR